MDKLITIVLIVLLCASATSCSKDVVDETTEIHLDKALTSAIIAASPVNRMDYYILADEYNLPFLPNQDPDNPATLKKVKLGQMLFFETGIAQDARDPSCYETYSCSSCHIPDAGFLPGRAQGIADGAFGFGTQGEGRSKLNQYQENELDAQGIRPLSTLNVAYVTNTLWSGLFGSGGVNEGTEDVWTGPLAEVNQLGFTGLESQNIEGVALHRMSLNDHVLDDYGYRKLFDEAFPNIAPEHRYCDETLSFALGAYLRTLLTTQAPFQDWLKGNRNAMTDRQKEGALLFFGEARCINCHSGPSFSSMNFHVLGTKDLYETGGLNTSIDDPRNLGRGMFTQREEDHYKFKVPQLYNVKDYATYFHGSSKTSLEDLLDFKIKAQSENPRVPDEKLSSAFKPLDLSPVERAALLDFLENALRDPNLDRYVPSSLPSGHCFPNNDALSRLEIGCE